MSVATGCSSAKAAVRYQSSMNAASRTEFDWVPTRNTNRLVLGPAAPEAVRALDVCFTESDDGELRYSEYYSERYKTRTRTTRAHFSAISNEEFFGIFKEQTIRHMLIAYLECGTDCIELINVWLIKDS